MSKREQIKIQNKKVKVNFDEWLEITKTILKKRKGDFTFIKRLKTIFKKDERDTEKEICKELIQRMDRQKVIFEAAQKVALISANNLKELKKDLPKVLIYLLGGGAMLILSIVFLILRFPKPFNWLNFHLISWTFLSIVNSFIFYKGLKGRNIFEDKLMSNSILAQAAAAYTYSRAPNKGGSLFEAYHYLDTIRKQNKEALNKSFNFNKNKK